MMAEYKALLSVCGVPIDNADSFFTTQCPEDALRNVNPVIKDHAVVMACIKQAAQRCFRNQRSFEILAGDLLRVFFLVEVSTCEKPQCSSACLFPEVEFLMAKGTELRSRHLLRQCMTHCDFMVVEKLTETPDRQPQRFEGAECRSKACRTKGSCKRTALAFGELSEIANFATHTSGQHGVTE